MQREIKPNPKTCKSYKNQASLLIALSKIDKKIKFDYIVYNLPNGRITPIIRVHPESTDYMIWFAQHGWTSI